MKLIWKRLNFEHSTFDKENRINNVFKFITILWNCFVWIFIIYVCRKRDYVLMWTQMNELFRYLSIQKFRIVFLLSALSINWNWNYSSFLTKCDWKTIKLFRSLISFKLFETKKIHIIIDCKMLNMKNDFILNENFWQNYRLCFDYDTLECEIKNNEIKHLLHDMNFDRSRFQMFNNEFFEIEVISRRAFEKFIWKNAKYFIYFICDIQINTKTIKIVEKFVSI